MILINGPSPEIRATEENFSKLNDGEWQYDGTNYEQIDNIIRSINTLAFKVVFDEYHEAILKNSSYFIELCEKMLKLTYRLNWSLNFVDRYEFYYHILLYLEDKIYADIKLAVSNVGDNLQQIINYIINNLIHDSVIYNFMMLQDYDDVKELFKNKKKLINSEIQLLLKGVKNGTN